MEPTKTEEIEGLLGAVSLDGEPCKAEEKGSDSELETSNQNEVSNGEESSEETKDESAEAPAGRWGWFAGAIGKARDYVTGYFRGAPVAETEEAKEAATEPADSPESTESTESTDSADSSTVPANAESNWKSV